MQHTASPDFSAVHAEILSTAIANADTVRELERVMAANKAALASGDAARINREYLARLAQLRGFKC